MSRPRGLDDLQIISRNPDEFERESARDRVRIYDTPNTHPDRLIKAREYTRALRAVKMTKLFTQPFVKAYNEHMDGVYALATHSEDPNIAASGSADGEIRIWDLSSEHSAHVIKAYTGIITGLCMPASQPDSLFACARDTTIRQFGIDTGIEIGSFTGSSPYRCLDHSYGQKLLCAGSEVLDIFDYTHSSPISTYNPQTLCNINAVKFNPSQMNVIGMATSKDEVVFYDTRMASPAGSVTFYSPAQDIAFNPQKPLEFCVASERRVFIFDYRNLTRTRRTLLGNTNDVMSATYSPVGHQIATGSFDGALKLFDAESGAPMNTFTLKRMSRVFAVRFTCNGRFVLSGSDDANVRLWKANPDESLHLVNSKVSKAILERKALVKRYKENPEIKRIARQEPNKGFIRRKARSQYIERQALRQRANNEAKVGGRISARSQRYLRGPDRDMVRGVDE